VVAAVVVETATGVAAVVGAAIAGKSP